MEIVDVRIERSTNIPFVTLRSADGRILPISTRLPEAEAIKLAHERAATPRPLTHELFLDALRICGAGIERLVITALERKVFLGELHLTIANRHEIISCRPTDGIALATRAKAPIFARADLLDQAAIGPEALDGAEPEEAEELVDEFRKFIDEINPDDFA